MLKLSNLVFLILVLIATFVYAEKTSVEAERSFTKAVELYNQGNMLNALDSLLDSLSYESNQPRVNVLISKITEEISSQRVKELYAQGIDYFKKRDYINAIESLSAALSFDYNNKDAKKYLYASQNALEKEVREKQKFVFMNEANRLIFLGDQRKDVQELLKAYDWYESVFNIDKKANWLDRWKVKRRIKALEKRIDNVIVKRNDYPIEEYHYAVSVKAYINKRIKDAINEWDKVIALNPENTEIWEYIRRYKKVTQLDVKLQRNIKKARFKLSQGIVYFNNKQYSKAVNVLQQALKLDPNSGDVLKYLEQSRSKLEEMVKFGEQRKRKELLKEAESTRKDRIQRDKLRAIKEKEQKLQKAKDKTRAEMLKLSDQDKETIIKDLYNKALREYALGNLKGAISLWEKILVYDPNNEKVLKNLKRTKQELKK